MKRMLAVTLGIAVLLLALAIAMVLDKPEVVVTETGESPESELASPAPGSEGGAAAQSGMTATLDPSGQRYVEPDPEQVRRMPVDAMRTSHEGLEVKRGPEGELSLDLQGRFRTTVVTTVDDEGNITTTCVQEPQDEASPERDKQ